MGFYISKDWALLSNLSAIAALAPDQIELGHDDELGDFAIPLAIKKPGASAKLFSLVVKMFKEMVATNPTQSLELQKRTLTALRAWAASETTGIAQESLEGLIPSEHKVENSVQPLMGVTSASNRKCHEILNALHADRRLALGNLLFFGGLHRAMILEASLNMSQFLEKNKKKMCFHIACLDNVNCYFFALILRHHELFHPDYGNVFYPKSLKAFISEARELDEKGLLQDYERSLISSMQIFLMREFSTNLELSSQIPFSEGNSLILDVRHDYPETWSNVSSAHRVLEYTNKILVTQQTAEKVDDLFSLEEVEKVIEYTFDIIEHLPSQIGCYRTAWQTVSKTRSLCAIAFKKVRDTKEALPSPSDHEWTLIEKKEKKQQEHNKAPATKKSKYKNKPVSAPQPSKVEEVQIPKASPPPSETPVFTEKVKPFLYHERVLKYFAEPTQKGINEDQRLHGFALAVDPFVKTYGIQGTWENPTTGLEDTQWSIPCEVEHCGTISRGVIVYSEGVQNSAETDNEEPVCYHRFIHRRTTQEMMTFIEKRSWEWNFPKLEKEPQNVKPSTLPALDGSRVIRMRDNVIEIDDPRNESVIRLFLVNNAEEKN